MKKRECFKSIRVLVCLIMTSVVVINSGYSVWAASANETTYETSSDSVGVDEVYVDGVEYEISFDVAKGIITVVGEDENSDAYSEMILDAKTAEAEAVITEDGKEENFDIEIEELSKSDVDVTVIGQNGQVDTIESQDELVEDVYEGQEAISLTFILAAAALVFVVYSSVYLIVHNNKTYLSANEFCKGIDKAAKKVKQEATEWYYPAWVDTSTPNNN